MIPRRFSRCFQTFVLPVSGLLLLLANGAVSAIAQQQPDSGSGPLPILTTAAEIARYPSTDPDNQPDVRLEATVTFIDTSTIFMQDDSGATFLNYPRRQEVFVPGQRISVSGRRFPGLFIGGIIPSPGQVRFLGSAPLPRPKTISREELASGRWHYQLVEVEGVVFSFETTGETSGSFHINGPGGVIELRCDQVLADSTQLIDARIRATGLAAGVINAQRQLISPYVRVSSSSQFTVLQPAPEDPFAMASTPIRQLPSNQLHRVKITGTALAPPLTGGIFIQDETSALFVQPLQPVTVKPGDIVEALGFIQIGAFSAHLANALVRPLASTDPPAPLSISGNDLASWHDAELLRMEVSVLQRLDSSRHTELFAQLGPVALTLVAPDILPAEFRAGTRLQATGICRVTATRSQGYRAVPTACQLLLRNTTSDVLILTRPPWWNQERLNTLLAIVAATATLALAWAALLKRQVVHQTAIIQHKIENEAVTGERQRIAREFHDTLEQELAGLALRLDAVSTRVQDTTAVQLLRELRRLLLRLQTETREFIWNLRDTSGAEVSLTETLRPLLEHLQAHAAPNLQISHSEFIPKLPPLVQHHLLSITREAVHNAIKYAHANTITVNLNATPKQLLLTISDDGQGFDPQHIPQGHFGLQGMAERAKKIDAALEIHSTEGEGTRIVLSYPL